MQAVFLLVFISSLVFVLGTALIGRINFFTGINVYFRIAILGFLTVPLVWSFLPKLSFELSFATTFVSGFLHLILGFLFAQFICLPDRSLTLRIVVECHEQGHQGLSLTQLSARFSLSQMINSRLTQLSDGGVLQVSSDGRISLLDKGIRLGRFILNGRRFFNIKSAN